MKKTFLLVSLLAMAIACQNRNIQQASVEDVEVVKPIQHLPDTSYPSVAKYIKYKIDTMDREMPGYIEDLSDQYSDAPGYFTFRGAPDRSAPFKGRVTGRPSKVVVDWVFRTPYDTVKTYMGSWGGGTGWTGQPLYVNWPDSLVEKFKNSPSQVTEDFSNEEIMVASLARHVYFIDFQTGKASREPLSTMNPVKGTISLDPSLNGRLYVGQALPMSTIGALVLDLFKHETFNFFGRDPEAWRSWGAYDSSPVAVGDFMIRPGENGTIYKLERFADEFKIHSTLRYKDNGGAGGMESSMAVYRNYGYIGDNHGKILCVNLDNLKPVWVHDIHDDTDATPVVQEENGVPMVYASCEVDKQGANGYSNFTKLNGLSGEVIWCQAIPCHKRDWAGKLREGGMFATPYLGRGDCDSLIFTNMCFPEDHPNVSEFIAMNKFTGDIEYKITMDFYAWSSPVGFLNEDNELFVVTGDIIGNIYLIQGRTGEVIFKEHFGDNFESSPVVIDSSFVVGSRGTQIFKMHLE